MLRIVTEHRSEQNRRFVLALEDQASVEAVLYRGDTLCVSCQVGCAVGCPFCASGARGLARPLREDELRAQVETIRGLGATLKRVTLSGVGEPLHNFDAATRFVTWCRSEALRPSLTTSGGPLPKLRTWLRELPHNGMTISVHSGTEAVRAKAVPKGPALGPLFEALAEELPRMSRSRRRRVSLAYLVVAGLNDDRDELEAFMARALPLGCDVHLFAYNPVPTSDHRPVPRARYEAIYEQLAGRGIRIRMSSKARTEANGGCGTLVALRPRPSAAPPSA